MQNLNYFIPVLGLVWVIFQPFLTSVEKQKGVIAAYYQNYSQYRPGVGNRPPFFPSMIDVQLLTDLYYAFAYFGYVTKSIDPTNPHLTGNFSIQPIDKDDLSSLYPAVMKLKQTKKDLKIFLSIGGWNFNNPNHDEGKNTYTLFSQMVASVEGRKQFISSVISYAHQYGFDGIDIDWEYPGDLTRGGKPEDFENFLEFLKECTQSFTKAEPKLYLSYTAPAHVPSGLPQNFQENPDNYFKWLAQCTNYVDRLNVMAYDYHGPFNIPKITGANAPLQRDTNPQSTYYIKKTIENCLNNGVPANKVILGIPTFGHSFAGVEGLSKEEKGPGKPFKMPGEPGPSTKEPGLLAYFEVADMIKLMQLNFGSDPITETAIGYNTQKTNWVSFDTPETIQLKAQFALEKGLQGVVFWAVDMDEYYWEPKYPNIRSAWHVFNP